MSRAERFYKPNPADWRPKEGETVLFRKGIYMHPVSATVLFLREPGYAFIKLKRTEKRFACGIEQLRPIQNIEKEV